MLRKPEQSTINPRIELETFAYFRGQKVETEREIKKNKTSRKQVWARMWGNRKICALLVGIKWYSHCGKQYGSSSKN